MDETSSSAAAGIEPHTIQVEEYDQALSQHVNDKEPEDPSVDNSALGDKSSQVMAASQNEGTSADQKSTESTTPQTSAAKKSFFEAIWERDHPDDVKKIKIAQEKKKIDEEAKKLQDQAAALAKKSEQLKNDLKSNKTKMEEQKKAQQL